MQLSLPMPAARKEPPQEASREAQGQAQPDLEREKPDNTTGTAFGKIGEAAGDLGL